MRAIITVKEDTCLLFLFLDSISFALLGVMVALKNLILNPFVKTAGSR
jgi:hypothetical protein